jgi:hypothetical protein
LPIEAIVHDERYERYDDERIRATYASRESEGWKRYMSFPELAEMIRTSGVENLANVYTQLKYTKDDNREISREIQAMLRQQGFDRF